MKIVWVGEDNVMMEHLQATVQQEMKHLEATLCGPHPSRRVYCSQVPKLCLPCFLRSKEYWYACKLFTFVLMFYI